MSEPENDIPHDHDHLHSATDNDDNWELNLGDELPDLDCDNISEELQETDLDEEIVLAPKITEESELDEFSQFLFNAQATAQKAERAREAQRKRPKPYHGDAPRTKRRQNKRGKDLAEKGYLSVFDFLKKKKATAAQAQNTDLSYSVSDSSAAQTPETPAHSDSESDSVLESSSEEEVEIGTSPAAAQSTQPSTQAPDCMDPVNLAHVHLKELLEAIQNGSQISDPTPESATDRSLNKLNYRDFPSLRRATASLSVKSKDKKLDVFFRARITAMAGTLNLYLDSELSYTWREASMIVARSQGHGSYRARCIRNWIHAFLTSKKGLSGGDLIYVDRQYSGHRMLPPSMIAAIKASILTY
ncbi:hypothetical protein B0H11DRAFT_2381653 [Mycena galericulata]|nr:hypothetical protein B0H11DRAFT_2381653 [Mycena galericulata]